jgi:curved DNA-binding protein CbpA
LQVAETASLEAIKGAYKFLSQNWHPDKNLDNRAEAERISRLLNEAYVVLSDPQRRKEHDQWIKSERARAAIPPSDDYAHSTSASVPSSPASFHAALWNPNAAANWSLLFPPVFGAWLHAKNSSALGDESEAKHSTYWVYGGILGISVAIFLPDKVGNATGIAYYLDGTFLPQNRKLNI